MPSKKIINFTPTGTQTTRENSYAPLTPDEIIEEVHMAYELGITMTHIHARDPKTFENSYKKEVYGSIIKGIRKHCPDLIICVSLTGRLHPEFEKRSEVLSLYPDMGSLTMSSLNFPKGVSQNDPSMIIRLIEAMNKYGVNPEIECFDSGMLNYTTYLQEKGILPRLVYMNMIFGNMFNAQSDIHTISSIVANRKEGSLMCFGGIGKDQLKSNIMGLLYADGIRIGLEDNLYYSDKNKATNKELLIRSHEIIESLGLEIMSPSEFKSLGFGNKKMKYE